MKVFALIVLLSAPLSYAVDDPHVVDCDHDHSTIDKLLQWFSSDDSKILNAPCKSKAIPSEEEMLEFIEKKSQGAQENAEIHGVKLSKEAPELLSAYRDFVTAKDTYGITDNKEKQKKLQSEYKINPDCQKVLCALEKVWGRDYAVKMLYIKLKHGFNVSEIAFNNATRFRPEELNDVLLGLEDLPPRFIPLGSKNKPLMHFERGKTLAMYKGKTLANAVVMIFDPWDKESRAKRQYTIFHEMAHNMSSFLDQMDRSPEWLDLSGWIKKGDDWEKSEKGCFVSEYGMANPWEDFAESVSSYRYNGEAFKAQCPEKYDFLKKNVYNNLEYLNNESCSPISPEKTKLITSTMTIEIRAAEDRAAVTSERVEESCRGMFNKNPPSKDNLIECSVKMQIEHLSPELEAKFKAKLQEEGVPYTVANRTLLKESLYREMKDDSELKKKASKGVSQLDQIVQKIAEKSFMDANPKEFLREGSTEVLKPDDYKWSLALKTCGRFFLSGEREKGIHCELMEFIKRDEKYQEWDGGYFPFYKVPGIFSPSSQESIKQQRNDYLIEHLKTQELTKKAMVLVDERLRTNVAYHATDRGLLLYKMNDWESMTPAKFCQETYGKASGFLDSMGFKEGEIVPLLYKKCVEAQSLKKTRFRFSDEEWKKLTANLK